MAVHRDAGGFTLYEESPKTVLAIKQISWSLANATVPEKLINYVKIVENFVEMVEEDPDYYIVTFNVTWSNNVRLHRLPPDASNVCAHH